MLANGPNRELALATDQIGRHRRQSIVLTGARAMFDQEVLTLNIAHFLQALLNSGISAGAVLLR
jgi:hypothetical protein